MDKEKKEFLKLTLKEFAYTGVPVFIAMFCIIVFTALSPWRWVTILLQIPVWIILLWWMYAKENLYGN